MQKTCLFSCAEVVYHHQVDYPVLHCSVEMRLRRCIVTTETHRLAWCLDEMMVGQSSGIGFALWGCVRVVCEAQSLSPCWVLGAIKVVGEGKGREGKGKELEKEIVRRKRRRLVQKPPPQVSPSPT